MIQPNIPIGKLEIIGYSTRLSTEMVPTRVAPVLRFRDNHDEIIFPNRIMGKWVYGYTKQTFDEFKRLVQDRNATTISPPIPTAKDHELWIDLEMQPHYELDTEVHKHLHTYTKTRLTEARRAFRAGDLDSAAAHARAATTASSEYREVWVLLVLIAKAQGKDALANVYRRCGVSAFSTLAEEEGEFDDLVKNYEILHRNN